MFLSIFICRSILLLRIIPNFALKQKLLNVVRRDYHETRVGIG